MKLATPCCEEVPYPVMETKGPPFLTYEECVGFECLKCGREWDRKGEITYVPYSNE